MRLSDYLPIFVILVLGGLFLNKELTPTEEKITVTLDTNKVKSDLTAELTPIIKAKLLKDLKPEVKEVIVDRWKSKSVNIDSLYTAIKDSVFSELEDSANVVFTKTDSLAYSGNLYTLKMYYEYYSRIPIDPESIVKLRHNLDIDNVTKTVEKVEYIERMLTHGISAGFGYGVIHDKFDVFIGYSVQLRLPF